MELIENGKKYSNLFASLARCQAERLNWRNTLIEFFFNTSPRVDFHKTSSYLIDFRVTLSKFYPFECMIAARFVWSTGKKVVKLFSGLNEFRGALMTSMMQLEPLTPAILRLCSGKFDSNECRIIQLIFNSSSPFSS